MVFTCKVARGLGTIAPCLEHVRAGGGGSVVIVPFDIYITMYLWGYMYITLYLWD